MAPPDNLAQHMARNELRDAIHRYRIETSTQETINELENELERLLHGERVHE